MRDMSSNTVPCGRPWSTALRLRKHRCAWPSALRSALWSRRDLAALH